MNRRRLLAPLLICASAPGLAHADDVDDAAQRVHQLSAQLHEIDQGLRPPPAPSADEAERRLVDAQVQYALKNWDDASILLFDIVDKYPTSDAYKEALWYLGDCLYHRGDYLTSRKYLGKLVQEVGAASPHYQRALARLLEVAIKAKDESTAQDTLARIAAIPQAQQDSIVPYARGKLAFSEGRYDEAAAAFESVPEGKAYAKRARYFLGATYVAAGELDKATAAFQSLLPTAGADVAASSVGQGAGATGSPDGAAGEGGTASDAADLVDLAHLALGRVLYERGVLDQAAREYLSVTNRSPHFVDALYEIAWVYVKGKDFPRALQALDLCLLADPGADTAAEAKLLEGNLQIRLAKESDSVDVFQKIKDEFDPLRAQLKAVLASHEDPTAFFQRIVASDTTLDTTGSGVPPLALRWIREQPQVARVTTVSSDEGEIKQDLADATSTIARVEAVIQSPERVNIFPDLADARGQSSTISNQLTRLREDLASRYHSLVVVVASPEEAQSLAQFEQKRAELEQDLAALPQSTDSLDQRIAKERARYQDLEAQAVEIKTEIDGFQAEIVAAQKYYNDTQSQQHMSPQDFSLEVGQARAQVDALTKSYDDLLVAVETAKSTVGVMDAQGQQEQLLKAQYGELIAKEEALENGIEQRLGGSERAKAQQIDEVLGQIADTEAQITTMNGKIDELVDAELVGVKEQIADAKAKVATYEGQLADDETETSSVGSGVVDAGSRTIDERLKNIVIRADVGLVDVAWALKQEKVDGYKHVADEEASQVKLMDQQSQDLLKEDTTPSEVAATPSGGGR